MFDPVNAEWSLGSPVIAVDALSVLALVDSLGEWC
jgi:hypothetical protein